MTRPVSKCRYADDIPFSKQDARKVRQLYSDLLVTMLAFEEFNTKRYGWITKDLLISCVWWSTNEWSWIRNDSSHLKSWVYPKDIIPLSIATSSYPTQVIKQVDFLAINCPPIYNVILGQPIINHLKAAISTHCLKVKFPTGLEKSMEVNPWIENVVIQCWCPKTNHPWIIEEESKTNV